MRIIWRTLPRLALPAALGLGLAYLATGFVPRPEPDLRQPEDLRASGQAYAEESPVRAILERNVLGLETTQFHPLGQGPAPVPAPAQRAALPVPAAQAAFAPLEPQLPPPGQGVATQGVSGGSSVTGRIQATTPPATVAPPQGAAQP